MTTNIVVGVNNRATALAACSRAMSLARMTDAQLHLVYAIDKADTGAETTARRHAEGLLESLKLSSSIPATIHVIPNRPDEAILMVAREHNADLIVIGNKGLTRRGRFTREAPAKVLRKAACSVLVVDTTTDSGNSANTVPPQPFS
jgi:nucleotide-binding universal stress UspA family protein